LTLGDADFSTICYARVSGHDQKSDLERQKEMLVTYCAAKGWRTDVISDLGSGMNFNKKGFAKLLDIILKKKTKRLVLTHKDQIGACNITTALIAAIAMIQTIRPI